jgi:hypothetical protein
MARNRHICAFFALIAFIQVNFRNRGGDRFRLFDGGPQKQVCIGLFHVTVQQLNRTVCGDRKIGGNGGFSGAALPTGDADNHSMMPP